MSTAEAPALPGAARVAPRNPARAWLRLFAAELRLVFLRKRNMLLLAVTVVFPVVIGIALRVAAPHPQGGGNGPGVAFFNQLAGNGVFLAFIALSTLLILVLPVVVAVVAGDSVAGEAGYGTLRYLLAVPAGRTSCSRSSSPRSWCSGWPPRSSCPRSRSPSAPCCSRSGR